MAGGAEHAVDSNSLASAAPLRRQHVEEGSRDHAKHGCEADHAPRSAAYRRELLVFRTWPGLLS